jgi:hypothetical protein
LKKIPPRPAGQPGVPAVLPGANREYQAVLNNNVETDDRGEYRVQLEPGTYWVAANKVGSTWQAWEDADRVTYFPAATSVEASKPLELAAGQVARANIRIVRQAGVRVAGKLIKPPGAADSVVNIPGSGLRSFLYTSVSLMPVGNALMSYSPPFANGQDDYAFQDVMPGKYTLMALTRDGTSDPTGVNQKAVFGLIRDIVVGERDMDGVNLALEPLRDLAGEVVFGEGCEPGPLEIQTIGAQVAGGQATAVSDADGKFVLRALTTGRLSFQLRWKTSGMWAPVASVRLGEQDVQQSGLEVPYQGDGILRIGVNCPNARRRQ